MSIQEFKCTNEEFDGIYDAVNKSRGEFVKVPREALWHLLDDHAELQDTIQKAA